MAINILSTVRVCRARLHRGVKTWGTRSHLVYFALVSVESHSGLVVPAALCLVLGLAAEFTGGPSDE